MPRFVAVGLLAVSLLTGPSAVAVDPRTNSSTNGLQACDEYSSASYVSNTCLSGALSALNAARANEGLGRFLLPSNFRSLSVPQQMFVLVNIERVDRGLWPVFGESSRLNQVGAASGASGMDILPCNSCWAAANWAGTLNAFWSHFLWMYDDGPGGPNGSDPWGHRHNILVNNFPGPLLMGAGTGRNGTGEVFEGADTSDRADVLTWTYESAYFTPIHTPTLHVPLSTNVIQIQLKGHSHTTVKLQVWNGSVWSTLANYVTPGTAAAAALWTKSVALHRGRYRIAAMGNTRYTRVISGTVTVL
ncbi:hypothetical protein Back2_01860 [Nocardioides baekrokdamisoli]|uniref:SCP domain-containing protein n=1 Tax=Nocardioides baekrokdamisoli TaxID=1804624 RepID=A0A3G9IYW9_9ACTN|nr:hypothetical protein Back2_01860 [Nocardioides baekrokdamisoli]